MVPLFVEKLQEAYAHVEKRSLSTKTSESDAILTFDDIHDVTYDAVVVLSPFGEGNPKPVFTFCDAEALVTKWFGKKGEHFEVVYVNSSGKRIKAIQFFAKKDIEEKVAKKHTLLAHLEKSYFGGKVELRLRIVEVK
jgi:single-stranded DNA-specific DHH superfamily exonuclease